MLSQAQINSIKREVEKNGLRFPKVFSVLGDPVRFNVFRLLFTQRDLCVTDIAKIFGISVPAASHHLKVLENAGLLKRQKMGQEVCYEINDQDPAVKFLIQTLLIPEKVVK